MRSLVLPALLFLSLLSSPVLSADPSPPLVGVVLPEAFALSFGARCLDGSPPAYQIAHGAEKSKFIVFLEGGGWCSGETPADTITSCIGRAKGGLGSSNGYAGKESTMGKVSSFSACACV